MWALIIDGIVRELTDEDPEGRFHPDLIWVTCDSSVMVGWSYVAGAFAPPPAPSIGDLLLDVREKQQALMQLAGAAIAPLQDASDLGEATQAEQARLIAWKRYRVELNRIEQQSGYPQAVVWPTVPDA